MSALDRIASQIADESDRAKFIAMHKAGDAFDAMSDGALHHAYPGHVADRMAREVSREYERATDAWHATDTYKAWRERHNARVAALKA